MLTPTFAGFNLWWISLDFCCWCMIFVFTRPEVPFALSSKWKAQQNLWRTWDLGLDCAYLDLYLSLDSTYVCLWCIFVFVAVQPQDERTRFANWILLYCLQFSLDSTMLISTFDGFNLWWISLTFVVLMYDFVFTCPKVPFVLSLEWKAQQNLWRPHDLGLDCAYLDLNFRWIQLYWFHSSLDSTFVCDVFSCLLLCNYKM